MRKILRSLTDRLCRWRARRRLSQYGAGDLAESLDRLSLDLDKVPGMMSPEAGPMLFILSATQTIKGDIVEVGSWQGRSTLFLARGAQAADNGRVFAVDHFLGNPGKQALYRVGREDLADLPGAFKKNIDEFNAAERVEMLAMPSASAAAILIERSVRARMLFIDGNHGYDAVHADFAALRPLLLPQALVAFDDFSKAFPGVVRAVGDLVKARSLTPLFCYGNCFVSQFNGG